jgi:hypothetical protein
MIGELVSFLKKNIFYHFIERIITELFAVNKCLTY